MLGYGPTFPCGCGIRVVAAVVSEIPPAVAVARPPMGGSNVGATIVTTALQVSAAVRVTVTVPVTFIKDSAATVVSAVAPTVRCLREQGRNNKREHRSNFRLQKIKFFQNWLSVTRHLHQGF